MDEIIQQLEEFRKRLIDLSTRNNLLNANLATKSQVLRFVDELPDQVFDYILRDNNTMYLDAVPQPLELDFYLAGRYINEGDTLEDAEAYLDELTPEVRETIEAKLAKYMDRTAIKHAESLGISTTYELPISDLKAEKEEKHQDNKLQTIHYYEDLDLLASKIRRYANSTLQEKGINSLFLSFGYLEWIDPRTPEKKHLAPLLSVPVGIFRETKKEVKSRRGFKDETEEVARRLYRIEHSGEDVLTNEALKLKLDSFGIILPDYDSELSPEDYFSLVSNDIISQNTDWKIHRYVSLSKLDFSGSLLYQDLDISKWLDGELEGHPLIAQLFGDREQKESVVDIELDKTPELDFIAPIVMSADSSQHSAIIDALKGKNMVIEGPPGTGKSQTIVNLISALLYNNKKVLFVAEKAAALSVVKDRMIEIGLGDFCLDLQNKATSNKTQVVNDLKNRLEASFAMPRAVEQKRNELNSLRKELADYTNSINKTYINGLTCQEILAKVVSLRTKLELANIPFNTLTKLKLEEEDLNDYSHERSLRSYFDSIRIIEDSSLSIDSHPWNFVSNSSLNIVDKDLIILNLGKLLELLNKLNESLKDLTDGENYEAAISSLDDLLSINRIGDYLGVDLYDYYTVSKTISDVKGQNYIKLIADSKGIITPSLKDTYYEDLNKSIEEFNSEFEIDLTLVSNSIKEIDAFSSNLDNFLSQLNTFFQSNEVHITLSGKEDTNIAKPIEEILNLMPLEYENLRDLALVKNPTKTHKLLDELESDLANLKELSKPFKGVFELTDLPSSAELKTIKTAFIEKNIFSFLSSKWRKAKKQLMHFSMGQISSKEDLVRNLNNLIAYAKKAEAIFSNVNYQKNLGISFSNENTNILGVRDLLTWYQEILTIDDKYGLNLDSTVKDIFMINSSSIDEFNEGKYLDKANNIETKLKIILESKANIPDDVFLNNLLQRKDEIIQKSNEIFEDQAKIVKSIELSHRLIKDPGFSDNLLKSIFNSESMVWSEFDPKFKTTSKVIENFVQEYNQLIEITGDISNDQGDSFIQKLIVIFTTALDNKESLKPWLDYLRNRQTIINDTDLNSSRLIAEEYDNCSEEIVLTIHNYRIYNYYVKNILQKTSISTFDEPRHKNTIRSFKEIDDELIKLNAKMISANLSQNSIPEGSNANKVKEKTNLSLIRHLVSKPKARISIRDLIKRASDALIAMSPCVMASPTTVAQYFKKEPNIFDVVIIDEASQIKPQDCISTIARCNQSIIVGDPNQMPPSSWMQASMESESYETGDETDADDAQSILDLAISAFPVQRMLKWHYRSQHESLIAFSNSNWYGENLVFFPSAVDKSSELGVQYSFVPNAVNNDSNRNKEEANKVVNYVIEHMRTSKNKDSIGVVAMNRNQQILIEESLEKKLDSIDDNNVTAYLESFANRDTEKYFVKNLENVQGDERDVIVISFTYAPKELGTKLPQTFSQLYGDGWRRLNVLLTRAKKKMMVFSSFKYHEVDGSAGRAEGIIALRRFLEYAQTGNLPSKFVHTGREADSDFEISVMEGLYKKGYECEPQIGVSSYRIDIGVHHPDFPGEFIMGVECDGATYHSSKSARDRDKLRESVLVRLGWRIERIWSTTWFDNPNLEIERIAKLIEQARDKDRKDRKPYEKPEIVVSQEQLEGGEQEIKKSTKAHKEALNSLIAIGKEQGYLTYLEINDLLPEELLTPEQVEPIVTILEELDIDVLEEAPETKLQENDEVEISRSFKFFKKENEPVIDDILAEEKAEDLNTEILALISESSGIFARDIADKLNVDKKEINRLLYDDLKNKVQQDDKYMWHEILETITEELPHEEELVVDDIPAEEKIEKQLIELQKYVESDFPDTRRKRRLLTDEMIKALTVYKPTSFSEFRSEIPFELRRSIDGEEAQSYLPEVFEIINKA